MNKLPRLNGLQSLLNNLVLVVQVSCQNSQGAKEGTKEDDRADNPGTLTAEEEFRVVDLVKKKICQLATNCRLTFQRAKH